MGMGEGVTYPSIQNLVRRWVPDAKRSRALAFIYSGHQLGTIASYLLCPLIITQLGWEAVFWGFGSLGFFWLLGWLPLVRDQPPAVAAAAAAAPAAPPLRLQDVPWRSFVGSAPFWAIVAAQCSVSVGNTLAFAWLPTFYSQVRDDERAGWRCGSVGCWVWWSGFGFAVQLGLDAFMLPRGANC